jgi:hypothetical protein
VVLDEPRATHIRWAFKTFALGQHTLRQLAEELTDRGSRCSRPSGYRSGRRLSRWSIRSCTTAITSAGSPCPDFYCRGRQKDTNGCQQGYVAVDRVEAAVAQHWEQYRLSEARRQELRAAVLELFRARTAGAEQEIASQQARPA